MSRIVAVVWHGVFSLLAGVLYFFFVLPRWLELAGDTSPTLGTALRIVTGVLIGLAALPVVFTWLRTRRPEYGTPQLALTLRVLSIVLHVLGGVLIVAAAISEIWLSLDDFGQWIFGVYGAAAAISLLAIAAFDLAFVAELPPPPPQPMKTKAKSTKRRGLGKSLGKSKEKGPAKKAAEPAVEATEGAETSDDEASDDEKPSEVTVEETAPPTEDEPTSTNETPADAAEDAAAAEDPQDATPEDADTDESAEKPQGGGEGEPTGADETPADVADATEDPEGATSTGDAESEDATAEDGDAAESDRGGVLRNRRPSGKTGGSRWRRKSRGGVAVED